MEAAPLRLLPRLAQSGRGARCLPVCLLRCQVNHKTLMVIGGQLLASLTLGTKGSSACEHVLFPNTSPNSRHRFYQQLRTEGRSHSQPPTARGGSLRSGRAEWDRGRSWGGPALATPRDLSPPSGSPQGQADPSPEPCSSRGPLQGEPVPTQTRAPPHPPETFLLPAHLSDKLNWNCRQAPEAHANPTTGNGIAAPETPAFTKGPITSLQRHLGTHQSTATAERSGTRSQLTTWRTCPHPPRPGKQCVEALHTAGHAGAALSPQVWELRLNVPTDSTHSPGPRAPPKVTSHSLPPQPAEGTPVLECSSNRVELAPRAGP